jgi:hypothetical protein
MPKFTVTYEVITPESSEHGDVAERGFVAHDGSQCNLGNRSGVLAGRLKDACSMRLRDAVSLINTAALDDWHGWIGEADGRQDYRTGAWERRALHPPQDITPSSYGRLVRLLDAR